MIALPLLAFGRSVGAGAPFPHYQYRWVIAERQDHSRHEDHVARTILNDEQWELVAPLLPGKPSDPGRSGQDNRGALEAILWIVRTGAPWRDLPNEFGRWGTIYQRFRR